MAEIQVKISHTISESDARTPKAPADTPRQAEPLSQYRGHPCLAALPSQPHKPFPIQAHQTPQDTLWNTGGEPHWLPCHARAHTAQHGCWVQRAERRKHVLSRKVDLEQEKDAELHLPAKEWKGQKGKRDNLKPL